MAFRPYLNHLSPLSGGKFLGLTINVRVNDRMAKALAKRWQALGDDVRRDILKRELKLWAKVTRAAIAKRTPKRTGRLARDISAKYRTYKGTLVHWAAVGGKLLRKPRAREKFGNDYLGAGWRLHFVTGPVKRHTGPRAKWVKKQHRNRKRGQRGPVNPGNYMETIARTTRKIALARIKAAMENELRKIGR